MTELLEAVDALTKPVLIHLPQVDDEGKWLRAHTTELPSLLTQLETAIVQSMSGKGGGGNPATRGVLDSDALYRFTIIDSTITSWCRIEKVPTTRDAASNLRRWCTARTARATDDDGFYIRQLTAWAGQITAKLDPPRRMEITAPCPECDATDWWDDEGVQHPYPVTLEYVPHDPDILRTARAVCRSCTFEWVGSSALRSLRWSIDTQTEEVSRSA